MSEHGGGRVVRSGALLRSCSAAACLAAAGITPAHAQLQAPHDSIVVSVLTMGPGKEVFERFGHQSIRIHDLTTGLDSAYNWGMFSFEQPHFLVRFLMGDTKYWMEGDPSVPLISYYRAAGRAVWEQELSLTRVEKDSLWRYLAWNARDENKFYRYDYYRDNCGTKVRDVLDMVLGGSIKRSELRKHEVSYRSETLRLARAYPLINFGMDFVLGRPADATLSAWEEMFIPMRFEQLIGSIRVRHSDGTVGRLVLSERQLVVDERYKDADAPPDYVAPALGVGLAIAGVLLALCMLPGASVPARWTIGIIGTSWNLLAGLVGLVLLFAELFTRHAVYMGQNVNVLLATPASLALAVLIPLAMRGSASPLLVRAARSLSVLAAVCSVTVVLLRVVPALAQENGPLLALAVPVQAALAFALRRVTTIRSGETV
ncbi:MAG: DUF4105 domain-containing protein [Gemmatimonadales bacterium]